MKKLLTIGILFFGISSYAQILNDSTVQFVAYWNLNETQIYNVKQSKFKITGQDTTSREYLSFDSEVTIVDSSSTGYKINWAYKNFEFQTDNKFTEKLMKIAENISVIYTTDELGVFLEIVNFEEIKTNINSSIDSLELEFKDIPNINQILQQVRETFTTKEAIESVGINEIQFFHNPFGAKYDINTSYSSDTKLPNLYGGNPFDAKIETEIVEVDTVNYTSVVKIFTTIDREQATEATFEYLKKMAKATNIPEPQKSDIPEMNFQIRFASNIHMPTGWVLYAINIKEVTSGEHMNIETTELTLK